jgi:hypothetical protein
MNALDMESVAHTLQGRMKTVNVSNAPIILTANRDPLLLKYDRRNHAMDFLEFAKSHGLPWAGIAIAAYAFWVQVVIPGRDRHFQFLDKIESAMNELSKAQATILNHIANCEHRNEDSKHG